MSETGPRGCRLIVDASDDIPLVWFQVAIRGGSAGDVPGHEGFTYHLFTLARRGAGELDRAALDEELDVLGASLTVSLERDSVRISALCLARNLDRVVELTADILARPRLEPLEHEKLLRETRMTLDEIRDDDSQLVARFFNQYCVPDHPYGRAVMGNETSLARIDLDEIRAAHQRLVVPENLIIGIAGAVTPARAQALAERLVANLPGHPAPPLPSVTSPPEPRGRRILVVDKPERTQSQLMLGHLGPRYGTPEALAMIAIETAFGGTFSSRLMQEIRVQRGWSYGANASLQRSRGAHWFRMQLAPSAEVTPDALALTWSLFEDVARNGITDEELAFSKTYLGGSLPFHLATARQRVRMAVQDELFGLPDDYARTLPAELAKLSHDQVVQAARAWLHPDHSLAVVVATAETMVPRLEALPHASLEVMGYDTI
jgi:zinc protease